MKPAPVFVAVDLGAESGRILACRLQDGRIDLEEMHRFSNGPVAVGEHIYWDVFRLWNEIRSGVALAVEKYKSQIVSVGVDTWGVDCALLDRDNELIGAPYHYRDTRTEGMVEEACRRVPREQIYSRTGIQFIRINTLYQLLAMAARRSPLLEVAESLLMIPDLFHFWLCGEMISEFTIATTTQFYDPVARDWSRVMLEEMGIPTRILKRVVPAGTLLGDLRSRVAREIRANRGIKIVAPAAHDTGSAVAATPLSNETSAYISSGTWSLVGMEIPQPVISDKSLSFNFTNEGGVCGTFRLLRNVMGLGLVAECHRAWQREGKQFTHEDLIELAAQSQPFKHLINPDDERFLAPGDMPAAIRSFCRQTNQPAPETEGEHVRCCLESLALRYRWVVERLEELTGNPISTIHIVGGGSQNRLLNQFTADATNKPVLAGPVEATATGNAMMQAMGLGYITSPAEIREVVRGSFELRPFEPKADPRWQAAYERIVPWLS